MNRVSKLLQKLNAFPYTRYLEECCVSLCEQYEYPSDEHLYYIIRLQRIMEAIEYMTQQHTTGPTARAAVLDLRSQLESFRNHLPFDLSDNRKYFPLPCLIMNLVSLCIYLPGRLSRKPGLLDR